MMIPLEKVLSVYQMLKVVQNVCARSRRLFGVFVLVKGTGVISDLPRECGQLPKGVQEGTMEETTDEVTYMAAVATIGPEIDEVEPLYEEARVRSDWPKWKEAIEVEL